MPELFDDLPEWLDESLWADFMDHRKQMKKPLTSVATRRMLMKLSRWQASGIDVNECLERSIINRWQDIYEPERKREASASNLVQDLFAKGVRLQLSEKTNRPH